MPEVCIGEAMVTALAELGADVEVSADEAIGTTPTPEQVELFPAPPFDFEMAYDELHRLDQRARLRKSAWEIAKADASDCKKSYDTAIEDLHKKFAEIERARSEALKPRLTTEGGETQPEAPPTDEPSEASVE
jgi:hypothetical protein